MGRVKQLMKEGCVTVEQLQRVETKLDSKLDSADGKLESVEQKIDDKLATIEGKIEQILSKLARRLSLRVGTILKWRCDEDMAQWKWKNKWGLY